MAWSGARLIRTLGFVAPTGYVVTEALRLAAHESRPAVLGVAALLVAAWASSLRGPRAWIGLGGSMTLAALGADGAWLAVLSVLGLGIALIPVVRTLLRFAPHDFSPVRVWGVPAALWSLSVWCLCEAALSHEPSLWAMPCLALLLSWLAISAEWIGWEERFSLGTPERMRAASVSWLVILAMGLVLGPAGMSSVPVVCLFGALGSVVAYAALAHEDASVVAKTSQSTWAISVYAAPIVALAALVAEQSRGHAAGVVVVTSGMLVVLGLKREALLDSFLPEGGGFLRALQRARTILMGGLSDETMAGALAEMDASLYAPLPPTCTSVVTGGTRVERPEAWPSDLVDLAMTAPHGVLLREWLESLEVRRADVRPVLAWMRQRDVTLAAVVVESGEIEGLLTVRSRLRDEPFSVTEVLLARSVADGFVGVLATRGAIRRSWEREQVLRDALEKKEEETLLVEHALARESARHEGQAARLSRAGYTYSAASRFAADALLARVRGSAPFCVVAPAGADVLGLVAHAHVGGPRRGRPLVVVDCAAPREHDVALWTDASRSPLVLADGGLLVLLDVLAAPHDVQHVLGRALTHKRTPWERADPLDVQLGFLCVRLPTPDALEPTLADWMRDALEHVVRWPNLSDRAEDLHALVTERLAREGMRHFGAPLGMEPRAYARLIERSFPGDESELFYWVQRLAAHARGDMVRETDIDAVVAEFTQPDGRSEAGLRIIRGGNIDGT